MGICHWGQCASDVSVFFFEGPREKSTRKTRAVPPTTVLSSGGTWISFRPQLLKDGFEYVNKNKLEVTDDVSIIEHLGEPVRITKGSYENLKVTTPEDLLIAERLLDERAAAAAVLCRYHGRRGPHGEVL
jgi:hypothetical protein